jgi:hypothetical protein
MSLRHRGPARVAGSDDAGKRRTLGGCAATFIGLGTVDAVRVARARSRMHRWWSATGRRSASP